MFSSIQHMSSDICFQVPSTLNQQQDHHIRLTGTTYSSVGGVSSDQKKYINNRQDCDEDNEKKKKKKMEHREIEKKRRQEMSNLSSSLRSLLPLHFIKGRRSMSEHMNQAVTYIKHLQKNIKVLDTKRDELKKTCRHVTNSNVVPKSNNTDESCSPKPITVTVRGSHGGITILIKSYYTKKDSLPISRVMKALLHEGLDVISCNSTKVNERLIHSIETKVIDETTCIQVSLLQKNLTELVNSTPS